MTPRTELRAGRRGGTLVPDAAGWRVRAGRDGSLTVDDPQGGERRVAAPGEVARVVLVRGADVRRRLRATLLTSSRDADVLAFLGDDDRVLLSMPLSSAHLGTPTGDVRAMRASSGIADVALTLGLTIEPASTTESAAVNAAVTALTRGATLDRLRRRRRTHLVLIAIFLLGTIAFFTLTDIAGAASVAVADVVALVPATVLAVISWRRARLAFGVRPPAPDGRVVVANRATADSWRWVRESELQVGRDDLVLSRHLTQEWLPGPSRGGVTTVVLSDDALWFLDRHEAVLTVVESRTWIADRADVDALADTCRSAGITFTTRRGRDLPPREMSLLDPEVYRSSQALLYWQLPQALERGALVVGANVLVSVGSLAVGLTNLALLTRPGADTGAWPVNVTAAVVGVTIFTSMVVTELRARRWNKRQMSTSGGRS